MMKLKRYLLKDIVKCCKDKHFQKAMEIFLNEVKKKYFLKLTQEGEKLHQHFNVQINIKHKEEIETSKLQKQPKTMQE